MCHAVGSNNPSIYYENSAVPSGSRLQIGPWKRYENVKLIRPLLSPDLQYLPDHFLIFKAKGDWVCKTFSWIQRSIAKITPFQVDPDCKLVPEKVIKNVKMIRPLFSADLQYLPDHFLILKAKGDWVCVSFCWIQLSIDPSRKFRRSKWIQIANWSLKKIWKMSKW